MDEGLSNAKSNRNHSILVSFPAQQRMALQDKSLSRLFSKSTSQLFVFGMIDDTKAIGHRVATTYTVTHIATGSTVD